jgi:hypothetical protein
MCSSSCHHPRRYRHLVVCEKNFNAGMAQAGKNHEECRDVPVQKFICQAKKEFIKPLFDGHELV